MIMDFGLKKRIITEDNKDFVFLQCIKTLNNIQWQWIKIY